MGRGERANRSLFIISAASKADAPMLWRKRFIVNNNNTVWTCSVPVRGHFSLIHAARDRRSRPLKLLCDNPKAAFPPRTFAKGERNVRRFRR
jgi:hypothetical protein